MPRYYFDLADFNGRFIDDEGEDLRDLDAVQEEAARCLADMARDAARRHRATAIQRTTIEVRDDSGPVLHVRFSFEIDRKN